MFSLDYELLLLAAGMFVLVVFLLTQTSPSGGKPKDLELEDESLATERFLRSVSATQSTPAGGSFGSMDNKFNEMIHRADLKVTPDQALGIMMLAGVVAAIGMYFWREDIWITALGFFVGMGLIFGYFLFAQAGYRRRLRDQLPDALFLIARSVRSGLSLEQAIELASQQNVQPLSGEFKQVAQQIKLGLSIPAALQRAASRIHLLDFDAFVSTVAIYTRTGGNLPLLLDRLAANARDHNQFRGYFLAATAQARLSAFFIGLFAPLIVLGYVLLDADHLQTFLNSDTGYVILVACFGLELVGAFWLYRMLKIDYY